MTLQVPSLKLTASLPVKMDGWKTILTFWVSAYSHCQTLSFRELNIGGRMHHPVISSQPKFTAGGGNSLKWW